MIIVTRGWPGTFYAGVINALDYKNRKFVYMVDKFSYINNRAYGFTSMFDYQRLCHFEKCLEHIRTTCFNNPKECIVVCGMNILKSNLIPYIEIGFDTGHKVYQALPYDVQNALDMRSIAKTFPSEDRYFNKLEKYIRMNNAMSSCGFDYDSSVLLSEVFEPSDLPNVPDELLAFGKMW